MRCPNCRKTNTLERWRGPFDYGDLVVEVVGEKCRACGEILFDLEEVGRHQALIAADIVSRGIRRGKDFGYVRRVAVRMKASELAALLDVRPETVSRWETETLELPRLAAFALGELYAHPRGARRKLERLATPTTTGNVSARASKKRTRRAVAQIRSAGRERGRSTSRARQGR